MLNRKPLNTEYGPYYKNYIQNVDGVDILGSLRRQKDNSETFLKSIPHDKWDFAYAPGKWTLKELWVHIIDTERIMTYRALRIARGDQTVLPGFEQDDYIPASQANLRTPDSIIQEYLSTREATLSLFENLPIEAFERIGKASGHPASVLSLAYIICGHQMHHEKIINERYL